MVQEERSRRKANPYIAAYLRGRMSSAASDQVSLKRKAARKNGFPTFPLFRRCIQQMRKMRRRC